LADVQLCMSSGYHPQSDGQSERVNQCMDTFLRCFVNACPKKWISWLSLAEYWYNTSYHYAIDFSPFQALYGHSPCHYGILASKATSVQPLDQWLKERHVVSALLKQHLSRAIHRMKQQSNKGRSELESQVGDLVFLKFQPHVQPSLAPRASQKLSFKFFGPYPVLERVGKVAYHLELPHTSSVHLVFHVSQPKKAVGSKVAVSSLPQELSELQVLESFTASASQSWCPLCSSRVDSVVLCFGVVGNVGIF
jgi:hypothetical protein